jgi:hypothetical protein
MAQLLYTSDSGKHHNSESEHISKLSAIRWVMPQSYGPSYPDEWMVSFNPIAHWSDSAYPLVMQRSFAATFSTFSAWRPHKHPSSHRKWAENYAAFLIAIPIHPQLKTAIHKYSFEFSLWLWLPSFEFYSPNSIFAHHGFIKWGEIVPCTTARSRWNSRLECWIQRRRRAETSKEDRLVPPPSRQYFLRMIEIRWLIPNAAVHNFQSSVPWQSHPLIRSCLYDESRS